MNADVDKKGGDDQNQPESLLRRYKSYYNMARLRSSSEDKLSAELMIQRRDDEVLSLLVEIVTSKEKALKVFPDPVIADSENGR